MIANHGDKKKVETLKCSLDIIISMPFSIVGLLPWIKSGHNGVLAVSVPKLLSLR